MSQRNTTFNCNMVSDDTLRVAQFNMLSPVLVATQAKKEAQISLSFADCQRMGELLLSEAAPHMNAHDLIAYHEEQLAAAKASILPAPAKDKAQGFTTLTPLAQKLVQHMRRAGSISHREAMNDYGLTGGSLSRRICDIEEAGFEVVRSKKDHPITGRKYTRYSLAA